MIMSAFREEMDVALRGVVLPALRSIGFKGSMPHFRRVTADGIDLLTIQFDKWGGGFVVEIGRSAPDGYTMSWGKHIPPSKVTAHDLHPDQRIRIPPRPDGADPWLRFDDGQTQEAAQSVVDALPAAEGWWREASPSASFGGSAGGVTVTG